MKRELDYIEDCLKRMGKQFNWGYFSEWTNHNYDVLSDEIQKTTGIAISSRTLRRLANRRIKYSPQIATKNALAMYLGFQNWEDYLLSKNKNPNNIRQYSKINAFILQYFWLLLFLVVVGLSSFFVLFYPSIELELNKAKVVFHSNDMKGIAPHTASFFYDVSKIKSSNIFIDNNFYDEGEIIPVKKNMHYYTNTFELPDYYAVKIIANGERLSCVGVHVVTNGWTTIVNNKLCDSLYPLNDSGYLNVPEEQLLTLDINTDNAVKVEYRNIRDFGITGDGMMLETKFINNPPNGSTECQVSKIEIINTHGRLSFSFVAPGCDEKMLKAEFGDVYLAGEFNNLNTFFQDMSYWRHLKIVTGDKRVGVYLDDVQIYSIRYNEPLDDIKGITFSFVGSGAVDYLKLFNENEELVYHDDFDLHN
ncbi:MAG: hypothetical protein ACOC0C_02105 [Bacteroidota bacterium]